MDDTGICNLALSHLGHSIQIASGAVLTERSKAAKACRLFLEPTRREVLRDFPWAFATGFASLNLIEEDPTTEWKYSYRVPEDSVFVRRLFGDVGRSAGRTKRPEFRIVSDLYSTAWDIATTYAEHDYASVSTGGVTTWYRALRETVGDAPAASADDWVAITGSPPAVLYTDQQDATAEYTRLITDVNLYSADFQQAFALLLASYIAPQLTGDHKELGEQALRKYDWRRNVAAANAANEEQPDAQPDSDLISSRD